VILLKSRLPDHERGSNHDSEPQKWQLLTWGKRILPA